jgi:hypothetical protein
MCFDAKNFILMTFIGGALSYYCKAEWTKPGTLALVRDFVLDIPIFPFQECLDQITQTYDGTLEPHLQGDTSSYLLGAGAFGLVFKIKINTDGKFYAVKVVAQELSRLLETCGWNSKLQSI